MTDRIVVLPLAAALSALGAPVQAAVPTNNVAVPSADQAKGTKPDFVFVAGQDLLGFTIHERSDGTVVAAHTSHASHASHASHHSHYSSR
jgi:hypothetical protein